MTKEEVQNIILQGEGYYTEFKRNLNSDLKKEMVAFANASGGSIYLGVDDDGSISGIKITNDILSQIQDAANECDPPVSIEIIPVLDNVLQIHVAESHTKPHRTTSGFYLRVGSNSQKLRTDAILEFLEKEGRVRFDERVRYDVDFNQNFSEKLWNNFKGLANINQNVDRISALKSLGAIQSKDDKNYFTNAGLLIFTENPTSFLMQAYITGVVYRTPEKVDIVDLKDFNNDIISGIENILAFIERHISVGAEITDTVRKDIWEIPKVALREAIVNAIVHRDYLETGARVMVEVFPNRIIISNPGGLAKGLSEKDFGQYSLTRNSVLANLMLRTRYIEKLGTGIYRMKQVLKEANLPEPKFRFSQFFCIEFLRGVVSSKKSSPESSPKSSPKSSQMIIEFIKHNPVITTIELAEKIGISDRAVKKQISKLKEKGIIKRVGANKGGHWEINSLN